jgi:hypothetical protein
VPDVVLAHEQRVHAGARREIGQGGRAQVAVPAVDAVLEAGIGEQVGRPRGVGGLAASAGGAPSAEPASMGADGASAASPSGWCTGVQLAQAREHI